MKANKKNNPKTSGFKEVLKRVKKVNEILKDAGYSDSRIEKFWRECKLEATHGTRAKIQIQV